MANSETTVKLKADITSLKAQFQAASRQIKVANSEFKATASTMDNWNTKASGLEAKIKQLTTTLDAQKTQLKLLESEYEKTKTIYGENSAAADKVKISINNMEASISNTEKQLNGYKQDLSDCKNHSGKFAEQTEESTEAMEENSEAAADLSDGYTTMKGVMADLVASGIKACISALKDLAEGAYEAYKEFDEGYDIIVAKTGATNPLLQQLSDSYTAVMSNVITETETAGNAIGEINTKFGLTGDELEDLSTKFIKFADLNNTDVVSSIDSVQSACVAWGVEAENVGDLLDLLNSTGQQTGASVDSLASSLTTNSATLKDMGLNLDEAVTFMGKLEVSGVDSSTVMAALKKALANASKEGKSTKEALSELQAAMESSDSTAEATVEAMELFGSKAGPAIAEACKSGRLNFNDLGEAMTDYQGNVDSTYETTLDGTDKIKLAWQGMKTEVGQTVGNLINDISPEIEELISDLQDELKDILKSVKSYTPEIKDKIKEVIEFAKNGINFLITNFDVIKQTIKVIGTILVATFVASKLASFVSMIGTMISTFAALKAATEAAETAQLLLNAAQMATPIGLVTAGVAALASALILVAANSKSYQSNIETLTDWEQTEIDKVYELKSAYEEVEKSRQDSIDGINEEYDYYELLAEELDSYTNQSGEVNKCYQERADFIVNTLNEALGTEIEMVDGVIQNYRDEKTALEELIETKRAQAVLSASEESYTTAIQNQKSALEAYTTSIGIYNQNKAELAELEKEYNTISKTSAEEWATQQGLAVSSATAVEMWSEELQNLEDKMNGTKGAIVESKTAYLNAEQQYIDYQTTIKNYEGLSSAIISGDTAKIKEALQNLENDFITAETGTRETLEQQVTDMETNYENLKAAVESGSKIVTQEMVDEAAAMVKAAKDELDKLPAEAEKSANNSMDKYASTLGSEQNKSKVKTNVASTRDAGANEFDQSENFEKSGQNNLQGYINGMSSMKTQSDAQAYLTGSSAVNSLDSGQESNSPSKATYRSGENFSQGFINGMNSKSNSIWTTAWNLAKQALNALKSGQQEGSPSKLTFQSGKYFTQGYINGITSLQKNLQNTVKSLVGVAVKEAMNVKNYDFSGAGSGVASKLADQLASKTTYMINKINYKNNKKAAEFDTEIARLEKKQTTQVAKLEKQKASDEAKIKKEKDTAVKNLERLKTMAETDAEKKRIEKEITKQKTYYDKLVTNSGAAYDKLIQKEKNKYSKLIETQNKYKTAYQDASSEFLAEFSTAVAEYSDKAQAMINETIEGIGDKFQSQYDDLIQKQDTLVDKLKTAGDLYSVSGAGVMRISDLKEQTKQITDYTNQLNQIKSKVSNELFEQIASYDMKEGSAFMKQLLAMSASDLEAYNKAYTEKMQAAEKAGETIYSSDIKKVGEEYKKELNKALNDLPKQLETLGQDTMKGFVDGLTKNTDYMSSQIKTFIESMLDTFKTDLKISSPSKVMEALGDYTGIGFVDGFKDTINAAKKAAAEMAQSVSDPLDHITADLGGVKASVAGGGSVVESTTIINNYELNQTNNSPKSLSALETFQATRRLTAMLKTI